MTRKDLDKRFAELTFDDFRRMAKDDKLSCYEKIGFPNDYREGKEELIFQDILSKVRRLHSKEQVVLDIGAGCSGLANMLIGFCRGKGHKLILVDSQEMLDQLPNETFVKKIAAYYPQCEELFVAYSGTVDVILTYSVLHYIFVESNLWEFLDKSLELLSQEGEMLIGDIPNISKRKRFFSSPSGIQFHRTFTGHDDVPDVKFNTIESKHIDDSVLISIVMRARNAGFDAYLLPQGDKLPMSNRREDILICRP